MADQPLKPPPGIVTRRQFLYMSGGTIAAVTAGGILAAVVLLVLNAVVARLRLRWPRLRRLVEGSPTLLVLRGEVITDHLRREGLDQETLETALREHGVADLNDVEMAVLEIDGSISVVPAGGTSKRVKRPVKYLRHQ
jgi:uncharacterized membrane protein YcaP (DUF421 family)